MNTVTLKEAQSGLADIIHRLTPGDEVVITENDQPVARLVPTPPTPKTGHRLLGTMRGTVLYMAPDFDAPLEDFKEYME
jgi:antitoxin (DNA-binding transcriptional repressor) of toxin-antitoxin stability system